MPGAASGEAKAGIAVEIAEGLLVSKGLCTAAKIGAKFAPMMKHVKGFHPRNLMDRIRARKKKPRDSNPTPTPKDAKPADATPDVKKQGDHEQVDEGKRI
jgi:hypothetical protein